MDPNPLCFFCSRINFVCLFRICIFELRTQVFFLILIRIFWFFDPNPILFFVFKPPVLFLCSQIQILMFVILDSKLYFFWLRIKFRTVFLLDNENSFSTHKEKTFYGKLNPLCSRRPNFIKIMN